MKTIVFGSINMDLVVRTPHLPRPGETLTGSEFTTIPGGKGANQAVAASRLGAQTLMVGRVGDDAFGESLLASLDQNRVDTTGVMRTKGTHSGVALIEVDRSGENRIVIVPGANGRVTAEDARQLERLLEPKDALLLQLEVPLPAVEAAVRAAANQGAMILLDPAPARPLSKQLLKAVDILTPNKTEAEMLTGVRVVDPSSAVSAAVRLQEMGARQVLLKLGAQGALWAGDDGMEWLPPFAVEVVDTVAAGDACSGGIAAALCAGETLVTALRWGMAAGALAVSRRGAQDAMPGQAALVDLLNLSHAADGRGQAGV